MQFVSLCLSKVDTFCGKTVYLPKCGGDTLSHRRWVSGETDGLVELVDCDFWFHCQESAGVHSDVYRVYNFHLVVQLKLYCKDYRQH